MTNYNTARLYRGAQDNWARWLQGHGYPTETMVRPPPETIARYLRSLRRRGLTTLPVHLSAIAALARANGASVDTRHSAIQAVMRPARKAIAAQAKER